MDASKTIAGRTLPKRYRVVVPDESAREHAFERRGRCLGQ